jgi:hypothetical protein
MKLADYRRDLQARKRELVFLLNERKKIDEHIARLQPLISHLEGLCHELGNRAARETAVKVAMTAGLTDAVRVTLKEAFGPLTPLELKEWMGSKGFDFSHYSLPLSSLHVVLQRLVKSGEVRVVPWKSGKKAYQWITTVDKLLSALNTVGKVAEASRARTALEGQQASERATPEGATPQKR